MIVAPPTILMVFARTAAGGEDDILHCRELVDRSLLAPAKARFALDIKDQRYVGPGVLLDHPVAVIESHAQLARELPTDRGLAGAHRTYQEYIAVCRHMAWSSMMKEIRII